MRRKEHLVHVGFVSVQLKELEGTKSGRNQSRLQTPDQRFREHLVNLVDPLGYFAGIFSVAKILLAS